MQKRLRNVFLMVILSGAIGQCVSLESKSFFERIKSFFNSKIIDKINDKKNEISSNDSFQIAKKWVSAHPGLTLLGSSLTGLCFLRRRKSKYPFYLCLTGTLVGLAMSILNNEYIGTVLEPYLSTSPSK